MRMRASLVAIVAMVTMSGCEQPGGLQGSGPSGPKAIEETPMLTTNAANYQTGAQATVRFTNRTNTSLAFSPCRLRLELRNTDGDWVVSKESLFERCTAEDRTLRPGQSVTYSFRIARPGTQRISVDLGTMVGYSRIVAVSNTFVVPRSD